MVDCKMDSAQEVRMNAMRYQMAEALTSLINKLNADLEEHHHTFSEGMIVLEAIELKYDLEKLRSNVQKLLRSVGVDSKHFELFETTARELPVFNPNNYKSFEPEDWPEELSDNNESKSNDLPF